jgi:hypothetical protein
VLKRADTDLAWRKSTYCGTNACIEVAFDVNGIAVRDAKAEKSPVLWFDRSAWGAFIGAARNGNLGS